MVYSSDLTRVFCSVTGFQFANMPKIYLCKCRNYVSYYFTFMNFCIYIYIHSFLPPRIRGGFLVFKNWRKRGVMKKLLRNRGLVKRGGRGSLRKEGFLNCFVSFPSEKHVFVTIGIFFFGLVNIHSSCN